MSFLPKSCLPRKFCVHNWDLSCSIQKATTMQTNSNRFRISLLFSRNVKFIRFLSRCYSSLCLCNNTQAVYLYSHIPPLNSHFKLSHSFGPYFLCFLTLSACIAPRSASHSISKFKLALLCSAKWQQDSVINLSAAFELQILSSIKIDHISL